MDSLSQRGASSELSAANSVDRGAISVMGHHAAQYLGFPRGLGLQQYLGLPRGPGSPRSLGFPRDLGTG